MKRYMLILSNKSESTLASTYESTVDFLRQSTPRTLPILPHLILFQSELDMEAQAHKLSAVLATHESWLLLEIHGGFRGLEKRDRFADLKAFFDQG